MSIMCCLYVPEGIVMAADSRLTRTKQTGQPFEIPSNDGKDKHVVLPQTTYTLSDNAQKVLLIKKAEVGVSFCGNAMINDATVADYIRRFEIEKVTELDTTQEVALKLAEHAKGTGTHFFVCGYDDDIPYVFDVYAGNARRSNIASKAPTKGPVNDAADDNTDKENHEVGIPENIDNPPDSETGSEEENEPIINYGAIWAGQKTAITKIVNNPPILNASWTSMPLKDATDFAEFLIDVTIKYERFCDDIQTCGGDIDVLVITKDEAFWKQHKIYNPIAKA